MTAVSGKGIAVITGTSSWATETSCCFKLFLGDVAVSNQLVSSNFFDNLSMCDIPPLSKDG
jgi:hypothetical protein